MFWHVSPSFFDAYLLKLDSPVACDRLDMKFLVASVFFSFSDSIFNIEVRVRESGMSTRLQVLYLPYEQCENNKISVYVGRNHWFEVA